MQWFKDIPGVSELVSASDFFYFFQLEYEPSQLASRHLHILKAFNLKIAAVDEAVEAEVAFELAKQLLADAYAEQTGQAISESSPLAVYRRMRPHRVALDELFKE